MTTIRNGTLTELVSELERQKKNSVDIVARSDAIHAVARENHGVELVVVDADNRTTEYFPMTGYAHTQLADKMGIPRKYYERMQEAARGDKTGEWYNELLAHNINSWMDTKEKRLLRVMDGQVRAILSDRYRPIDNYDLLWSFLEAAKKFKDEGQDIKVMQCDVTETNMYIKTMMPTTTDLSRVAGTKDTVQAMMLLQNSEIGAGRMAVALGMWRMICSNGLWGEDIVSRVHIGGKLEEGVIEWSEQTVKDTDIALFDQVKDTVATALQPRLWEGFVQKAAIAGGKPLDAPLVEIVDAIAPKYQILGTEKAKLLEAFAQETATPAGKTLWGLANAFTRLGRDSEDADRQVQLEKIGGELIAGVPAEVSRILVKSVEA